MIEGLFIVVEGIDGSGSTTQVQRLCQAFRARGLPIHATREPSDGPIGTQIRQILRGRIVVQGLQGPRAPSDSTMALLFAADRMDHLESEILPNLLDGVTVVCDRYYYSSIAYQSASDDDPATVPWLKTINRYARTPDLVIVLELPESVASKRRDARGAAQELYEVSEIQQRVAEFYHRLAEEFPDERIEFVDANRPVDDVAFDVMNRVRALRGEAALAKPED